MSYRRMTVVASVIMTLVGCSKLTDEELMKKAIEAHKLDHVDEATQFYQQVIDDYPRSPKVPEALYAIGNICESQRRDLPKALAAFKKISSEYPDHPTASSAAFLVGFIYNNELKNYDSAKVAYEYYIRKYPLSPMVSSAQFELDHLGKDPAEIMQSQIKSASKPGALKGPRKAK